MEQLLAYYLVVALSFLSAFITTLRFYQVRIRAASVDDRAEFTPILAISLSFLVGLVTALLNLVSVGSTSPAWLLVVDLASPLFGLAMSAAVLVALRRPRFIAIGLIFLAVSWFVSIISSHPLQEPARAIWVIAGNSLLVIPMLLFGYLWLTTKRSTAFGLLMGIILYLGYHDVMALDPIPYGFVAIMLVTLGWAFTSFSFLYYDKRLGGEIIGYAFSITVVAGATAGLLIFGATIPLDAFLSLFLIICSGAVSLLAGSYLYGRYRENAFRQTLALSLFMLISGFSWIMSAIYGAELYAHMLGLTASFRAATLSVGLISAGFLFLSAAFSLELGKLVALPMLLTVPTIAFEFLFGPDELWVLGVLFTSYSIMAFVPIAMFAVLWRRIRLAKEKDAGKPLGIFLGLILISISTIVTLIPAVISSPLRLAGVLIIFLGVSARIDTWFYSQKPQKEEQTKHG